MCQQKGGLEATGILSHMCKAAGLGSVSDLLAKNPAAKRPASATADSPAAPAKVLHLLLLLTHMTTTAAGCLHDCSDRARGCATRLQLLR